MKQTGMLVVSLRDVNFYCLVLLRVYWEKTKDFKLQRSGLGLRTKKNKLK